MKDRVFSLKRCKTSASKNMERFSKCRATEIEAIKVVKYPEHRQAIKPIKRDACMLHAYVVGRGYAEGGKHTC